MRRNDGVRSESFNPTDETADGPATRSPVSSAVVIRARFAALIRRIRWFVSSVQCARARARQDLFAETRGSYNRSQYKRAGRRSPLVSRRRLVCLAGNVPLVTAK